MGGRRPTRTVGMTPEEEERRQIRRERNKMAAARCRKRRMDHTNALLEETEGLEQKKQSLQEEIQQLQQAKDELEFILEAHRAVCRLPTVPRVESPSGNSCKDLGLALLPSTGFEPGPSSVRG